MLRLMRFFGDEADKEQCTHGIVLIMKKEIEELKLMIYAYDGG